jgi:hypothetical protein
MGELIDFNPEEMDHRSELLIKRCAAARRLTKELSSELILELLLDGDKSCKRLQDINHDPCIDCRLNGIIESPLELLKKPEPFEKIASKFPIEVIPEPFRKYCEEAARCSNCAVDNVALPLLAYWSVVVGNRQCLEVVPGWQEFCNLWVITIGEPSTMKSTGRQKAEYFINQLIKKACKIYEHEVSEWEKTDEKTRGKKPRLKRYLVSNATMEAIDYILYENPVGGIVSRTDELTQLLRSMNQYKNGGGSDRSNLLDLWDTNVPRIIDRKAKDPIIADKPFVSIVGSLVPSFLNELRSFGKEDGLTTRFLFGFPQKMKLHFSYDNFINPEVKEAVSELFDWMDSVQIDTTKEICFFTDESHSRHNFKDWLNEVHYPEEQSKNIKPEEAMQLGKIRSYVIRLALIFHTMEEAINQELSQVVTDKSLQRAITLVDDYFKPMIEKTFGIIGRSNIEVKAEYVMEWLWKKSENRMAVYKINFINQNCLFNRMKIKMDYLRDMLIILQDMGYGYMLPGNEFLIFDRDPLL